MPGTFLGLETARRGIRAHQHSLDITGHNLANASTPGYSRQEGVLKATDPYSNITLDSTVTPGQFGTGVEIDNIRRIRDEYLDYQVRRSITDTAFWGDQISVMQRAEASFAEPATDGIGQRIVDFFKTWMDLNNSPQDPGVKAAVVQLGDELASLMSYTYNQLTDIEKSVERPQIDVYANRIYGDGGPTKLNLGGNYTGTTNSTYIIRVDTVDAGGAVTGASVSIDGAAFVPATVAGGIIDAGSGITIDASTGMNGTENHEYQFNVYANHTEGKFSNQLDRVNDILTQIRDLTKSIKQVYSVGQQPNDLLDKRDVLLEELSRYGPVEVTFETVNGKPTGEIVTLKMFGYNVKQDGVEIKKSTDGGQMILEISGGTDEGAQINLTEAIRNNSNQGGSLLGLESARLSVIEYKAMLNDMAITLRDRIEARNSEPPAADHPEFFTGDLATGNFKVDNGLKSNPALLDGTKAQDIANLREENIAADKPFTFEEYYSILLTQVGGKAQSTGDMAANQAAIKSQITGLRDSVSGVSIDEELTKLIQFQYGFQASARVVSAVDEMLDVIINRLF